MGKYRGLNITGGLNANFRKIKVRKTLDTMELLDRGSITEAKADLPTKGAAHRRGRGALKSQRKGANSATRGSISMGWIAGDDSNVVGEHDYGYVFRNAESSNSAVWNTRRALGVAASIADEQNAVATAPVYATGVSLYNSTGIIPAGTPLILNEDGTVSAVQSVPGSNEAGTLATYGTGDFYYPEIVYDSANSKAIFFYHKASDKNGYARVVSIAEDGTLTYGAETLMESGNGSYGPIQFSATMAGSSVVIASRGLHNGNRCRLVAGTVNGTSISFGSPQTVYTTGTNGTQANEPNVVWDPVNNKGMLTYAATNIEAAFFTVSGNSVSVGSPTILLSPDYAASVYGIRSIYHSESGYFAIWWNGNGATYNTFYSSRGYTVDPTQGTPSIVSQSDSGISSSSNPNALSYDTSNGKVVLIGYQSKNYVVASIDSNGTITYGTPGGLPGITDNSNVSSISQADSIYDPTTNLHVADVRYNDGSTQTKKYLIGSLSGDTVSWEASDSSTPDDTWNRRMAYDTTNNKIIIHYAVSNNVKSGGGYVLGAGAASSNLTDSNFIGFAKDGFSGASLGKVVSGGGVVGGFTGLIAGNDYYVQPDGSISQVSAAPAVLAGTALSDTTLQVASMSPSYSYSSTSAVAGTTTTSLTNNYSAAAAITLDGNTVAIGYDATNTTNENNGKVVIHTKQNGVWTQTQVINCPTNTSNWNLYTARFGSTIKFTDDGTRMLVDAPGYGTWENNYGGFFIYDKNETTGLYEETQRIFNQQDFYISSERGSRMHDNRIDITSDGTLIAVQQAGVTGHYNSESKKSYILIYRKIEDGTYSYVGNKLISDQSYYNGTNARNIALSDNGHIILGHEDAGTAASGTQGGAEHCYFDINTETFTSQYLTPSLSGVTPVSGYNLYVQDYGLDVAISSDGMFAGVIDRSLYHQAKEDGSSQSSAVFIFKLDTATNTFSQVQILEHADGLGQQTQSLQFNRTGSQLYTTSGTKLTVYNWDNETNAYVKDSTTDGWSTYQNRFWMSRDGAHILIQNGTSFNTYGGTT